MQYRGGEEIETDSKQTGKDDAGEIGLGDVDACRLGVVVRQVDSCHDAASDAEHHAKAGDEHHDGCYEIHACQSFGSHAVAYKDSVGDGKGDVEGHTKQCWDKEGPKQLGDVCGGEIYMVSVVKQFEDWEIRRFGD